MLDFNALKEEALSTLDVVGLISVVSSQVDLVNDARTARLGVKALQDNYALSHSEVDKKRLDDAMALSSTLEVRVGTAKKSLKSLNEKIEDVIYDLVRIQSTEPLMDIIRLGYYPVYGISGGTTDSFEFKRKDNDALVNLKKVDERGINMATHGWGYAVERFAEHLARFTAKDVGSLDKKAVDTLFETYAISKEAKDVNIGKVPGSIGDIEEQLQKVVDRIIFIPREDGKNELKVISVDAKRIMHVLNKDGSGQNVVCGKSAYVLTLVTKALIRIATGGKYSVEFDQKKKKG